MSNKFESVKEPTTPEELRAAHEILRADPERYLSIVNGWIADDPESSDAYFGRHLAWMHLDEPKRALEDLDTVIRLRGESTPFSLFSRGLVHRRMGEYGKALKDFASGEAIDPEGWEKDIVFGLLYQADAHARLGNEEAALSHCARLPDDFWTPGVYGAPGGDKAEIADELRRIAAEARSRAS
jgi:tetratricopeptide (TPR) repeat protein